MVGVKNVKMQFSFIINSVHDYDPENVNSVNNIYLYIPKKKSAFCWENILNNYNNNL